MGLPVHDLYRGDRLIQASLGNIWQVSVNGAGDDFALLADKTKGPGATLLVRRESVETWDRSIHGFLPPVFAGQDLVSIQEHGALLTWFTVKRGQRIVYLAPYRQIVASPFKGLASWQGRWVLELDGRVLVDGKSLNRRLGYDEIFNWRLLDGQPFYFFRGAKRSAPRMLARRCPTATNRSFTMPAASRRRSMSATERRCCRSMLCAMESSITWKRADTSRLVA